MPEPKNWVLIKIRADQTLKSEVKEHKHFKTIVFLSRRFKESIINSLAYAFISSPLIELPVKMAIRKGEAELEKSIIDVLKRRFTEDITMEIFRRGGLGSTKKGYLVPYYKNKPYWIFDEADARRYDIEGNNKAIVDIKMMFINMIMSKPNN